MKVFIKGIERVQGEYLRDSEKEEVSSLLGSGVSVEDHGLVYVPS